MTILVVGGAGYIGSHTCKALKKRGYLPVVYDNLQNGHRWAVGYGPLVVGDLLDQASLSQTLKIYKPKAVLHFASSINVRESMQDPGSYYQNNVVGTLTLLQAMQKHAVSFLIFSSTAAVYGAAQEKTLCETHPCAPANVYGMTKWMAEQIIHDYETAHQLNSVILRYFNAAGADLEGELGEAHQPETHLIPLAIQTALGLQDHLPVFGTDHNTFDGTAIRDYIHVSDLANAHVKALEWLLSGKGSMTFNLGTGYGHSLNQVISMVEKVSQKPVKQELFAKKQGEPSVLVASAEKAQKLLKWTPLYSDLETIVSSAYSWHQKRGSL
jgi:UDP-arabinose 4-epimerase